MLDDYLSALLPLRDTSPQPRCPFFSVRKKKKKEIVVGRRRKRRRRWKKILLNI